MTDSDTVNLVRVIAKRTPFLERAKELCAQRVLNTILRERQETTFYSIMCDATPDVSNLEQHVLLLRYLSQTAAIDIPIFIILKLTC